MGQSLVRQWRLVRLLSCRSQGISVQEIARELEVNIKTVRRDLETLQDSGFAMTATAGPHGLKRWSLTSVQGQPALSFALDEALALYLGRRLLDPLAGTYIGQAASSAFAKIRAGFGAVALAYVDKLAQHIYQTAIGAGDYASQAEIVDELFRAIEERLVTLIGYQSAQSPRPVTYEVSPYGLVFHRGSLYLVAASKSVSKKGYLASRLTMS